MNFYRVFYRNKHHELLKERDKLFEALSNKQEFSDADIKAIMDFKGIGHKDDYKNSNAVIVTKNAFRAPKLEDKFMVLKRLRGVGMVMASAILMFQNPYKYAIIDSHAWNLLVKNHEFEADPKKAGGDYTVKEYETYMNKLKELSDEYGMKPADVEFTLYLIDKEKLA